MPLPRFQNLDQLRKRAILTAAAEEFGERGFAAASYNRIIERAGISKGAMYYYFADKDDLIFQLGDLARERLANKPDCPRSIDRVSRAEEGLGARKDELAEVEQQMNDEDAAYQEFVANCDQERADMEQLVKKWRKAVD